MAQNWQGKSLVGQRLGQFEVKSEIARGGMGVVYKGYQPSLDRWVAIKTLPMDLAGDKDLVMRFQREAEAMVRLNHANIVQIIDRGQDAGQYYFAMEFVEGPSVKDLLKSETIDTDKIFDVLVQTCEGLEYAHKKGLVHRDIKPANLLFEEKTGVVKIADFGIAHFSKKDEDMLTLTAKNVGMGTMNYMAPEQKLDAASVDHRADIYAMGVIIYEAFTGKLPLGKFKLPSELNPKLPRELDAIVQRCLEADPKDRYSACAELKAQLVAARAAIHDRTLKRSMRDALDRTLTAFGPNRMVGIAVLSLLLVLFLGGVGGLGLLMLRSAGAKKALQQAEADALTARDQAAKVVADGFDGQRDFQEAKAELDQAASASGDVKLERLKSAAQRFAKALSVARESRAKVAGDLGKKAQELRTRVAALGNESLKGVAAKRLDEAAKALEATETFVPALVVAKLDDANAAATAAEELARLDATVRPTVEKAADDENKKLALAKFGEAVQAAQAGNATGVTNALKEFGVAANRVKDAPPVVVADPTKTTTPTPNVDPSAAFAKREEAQEARAAARSDLNATRPLLTLARKVGVESGTAEFEEGAKDVDAADGLDPEPAIERARHARERLRDARAAALAGLTKAHEAACATRDVVRSLAPKEQAAAVEADRLAQAALGDDRIAALAKAVEAWRAANDAANAAGEARFKATLARVEPAREAASARSLGDAAALEPGNAALARAQAAAKARDFAKAVTEAAAAESLFLRADARCPTRAHIENGLQSLRVCDKVELDQGIEVVAGFSRGFVVATHQTLRAYSPEFKPIAKGTARKNVKALVPGDGDFVFAGLLDGSIQRFKVGNEIELDRVVVENTGGFAGALGYDRVARLVYAFSANDRTVSCYSEETGKAVRPLIDLKPTPVRAARTIAVLRDGSVVVHGQSTDTDAVEKDWAFAACVFRFDAKANEWTLVETRKNAPGALAAAGDGLVGIEHAEVGRVFAWPTGAIASEPEPGKGIFEGDRFQPRYAFRLSIYGSYGYVLDIEMADVTTNTGLLLRKRIVVYKLDR